MSASEKYSIDPASGLDAAAMLTDLADSLEESVLFLSETGTILAANRTASLWLGLQSKKSLVGRNVFDFIPPELVEPRKKLLAQVVATGRRIRFEDETDTRTYAHKLTPHLKEDRSVRYVSAVTSNITHLRRSDQKLRREQQRQIFFMESLPGFFYLVSQSGDIHYSNRTFKRYFGRPTSKNCKELSPTADEPNGLCPPEVMFTSGKPGDWEWGNPSDSRTFHLHCHPMTDIDGTPLAAILGIDVTLRKQAEAQLLEIQKDLEQTVKRRTGELEQANVSLKQEIEGHKRTEQALKQAMKKATVAVRAKAAFLANMSHEIRTPMNAVIGMAELALHTTDEERRQHFIEMVKEAGNSLLTIINDILDYSKVEAQKLTLEKLHFNLPSVIEAALRIHQMQASSKGLWLRSDVGRDVPEVVIGDPVRLGQILTNLIGNALKFTEQGGIDVAVRMASFGEMPVQPIQITVQDTGIGIPEDKQEAIFDSFSQVDAGVTRQFGGTGLGLTISRHLVQLMGGDITLHSEPGGGSSFTFSVLLERGDPAQVEQDGPSDWEKTAQPMRLLLVEDNELNRELAHTVLADLGHEVTDAANGEQALDQLAHNDFDMVFMDVQMPGMDGVTATRLIRAGERGVRNPRIPIVAMTAHAMKGDRERFLRAGMSDYLSKPLELNKLFRTLNRYAPSAPAEAASTAAAPVQPAAQQSQESPVSDRSGALERLNGNEPLLDKLYELFLSATPTEMDKLSTALTEGRHEDAAIHAHTLKGTSATIGAQRFHVLAKPLEDAVKQQDDETAERLLEGLRATFEEFERHVEATS